MIKCVVFKQLDVQLVSSVELSVILFILLEWSYPKDDQLKLVRQHFR